MRTIKAWNSITGLGILLALTCSALHAQDPEPGINPAPILKLDAGPSNFISQLDFSSDGKKLYAAGWDKVVYVWNHDSKTDSFQFSSQETFRIPIGVSGFGLINAMTVSPSGNWLAVGGRGWSTGYTGARSSGFVWPNRASDFSMLLDRGQIHLWNTATRELKVLRGHAGVVKAICFLSDADDGNEIVVSVAEEVTPDGIAVFLRAWNVGTGKQIQSKRIDQLSVSRWIPILRNLENSKRIVLAWGEDVVQNNRTSGRLWIWDIVSNDLQSVAAPRYSITANTVNNGLWTGAIGRTQKWTVAGQSPRPTSQVDLGNWLPVSSAKSTGGNETTKIVYVMRKLSNQQPSEYKAAVLDTKTNRVTYPIAPWTDVPTQSPVVVSPDNKYLAIARQTRIYLYDIATIQSAATGAAKAKQILGGAGQAIESLAFAKKGEATGLLLTSPTGDVPRRSVFNFDEAAIDADPAQWNEAAAEEQGWKSTVDVRQPDQRRLVAVSKDGTVTTRIDVLAHFPPAGVRPTDIQIDATAICPPSGLNPPLVAIAYSLRGEPSVDIFHAQTGEFVRTLSGHGGRVTQLVFRADGNVLASASIDRTVRLWNVGNIEEKVLGKVGMIHDFIVTDENNGVVVFSVKEGSKANGVRLKDMILGFVENGRLFPISRSWGFYRGLSRRTPGDDIVIRVSRNGATRDFTLKIQQGADEAKPILTLFFDDLDQNPRWIAWSQLGKYDASDDAMERLLGWHFNPSAADRSVQFASVAQYRPEARDRSLFRNLLNSAVTSIPVPQTAIGFLDANGDELFADDAGVTTTRTRRLIMIAEVNELPKKWLGSVQWRIGNNKFQDLPREFDSVYGVEITSGLSRKPVQLDIRVRTRDQREYVYSKNVRYVPAKPTTKRLSLTAPVTSVKEKSLTLSGSFQLNDEAAEIEVQHILPNGKVKPFPKFQIKTRFDRESSQFEFEIAEAELQLGKNQFQIAMRNSGDTKETEAFERLLVDRTVFLLPPKPPALQVTSILSLPENEKIRSASAGVPLVVSKPLIRISGMVTSAESPKLFVDDATVALKLVAGNLQFTKDVKLKQPGKNSISMKAVNTDGDHKVTLDFEYRPELPKVSPNLSPGRKSFVIKDGKPPEIRLTSLVERSHDYPATWQIIANGKVHSSGRLQESKLDIPIKLEPEPSRLQDRHRIQLRISNEWKQTRQLDLGEIRFLHPPTAQILSAKQVDKKSLLELKVKVKSPFRTVVAETVSINGKEMTAKKVASTNDDGTKNSIEVVTYHVPISVGTHTVGYVASNNDGSSQQVSKEVKILPAPKPAKVRFESPVAGESFGSRDVKYQIFIQSESRIRSVDIIHKTDGFVQKRTSLRADQVELVSKNRYLIRQQIVAENGENGLEVLIENEAGLSRASVGFTIKLPPVAIKVDRFVADPDGKSHLVTISRSGLSLGTPLQEARVRIQGRLQFNERQRPAANSELPLRIWTNGFLKTESIKVADAAETKFDVSVVLNQRQNRIRLEVPSLVVDEASQWFAQDIRLESLNPERGQRLRLLGMGVQIEDGSNALSTSKLKSTIETALRTKDDSNQAFSQITKYGPLGGNSAKPTNFIMQFMKMKADIRDSQLRGDTRDLVLIYYQGRAVENREHGFILQDVENWQNPSRSRGSSITSRRLVQMLKELPGAHVLLLDVAEESPPKIARAWPREPTLGIIRLARSENQLVPKPDGGLLSMLSRVFDKPPQPNEIRLRRVVDGVETEVAGRRQPYVVYDPHLPTQFSEIVMYRK